MPILRITTNVAVTPDVKKTLVKDSSALVAKILEKPEERVIAILQSEHCIIFGGSDDGCIFAELSSIGKITPDLNKKYSQALCAHFHEKLGVSQDRIYIRFEDVNPANLGHNGSTKA